jgi:hypothetical protein
MNTIPTEAQWEDSERRRLGLALDEWDSFTIDEDWNNPRPVVVQWGDSQETPTQRLDRFANDLAEAWNALGAARAEHLETIRATLPAATKKLITDARGLIGPDPENVDDEYIRAQAELIAVFEVTPDLPDYDQKRAFVLSEITRGATS